jgi:hypothetical protein
MSGIMDTWLAFAPPPDELKEGQKWNVFLSYRSVNRRGRGRCARPLSRKEGLSQCLNQTLVLY